MEQGRRMDIIFNRRSIRTFLDQPVEGELIERILRAGMQAPSSKNCRPWEFIVLSQKEDLKTIAAYSPNASPLAQAPCAIVVLGNTRQQAEERIALDLSACTQNMLLEIASLGLGGVWLGFFGYAERMDKLREFFSLPPHIVPFAVIALGRSEQSNHFSDRFQPAKIHYQRYSSH
jgi:nitroreductase